uniref:Uncharacterized protein n=1 Tax=Solanum lycopersicum TaxID=4081 RepID=A0A3Q7F057_SOLLC
MEMSMYWKLLKMAMNSKLEMNEARDGDESEARDDNVSKARDGDVSEAGDGGDGDEAQDMIQKDSVELEKLQTTLRDDTLGIGTKYLCTMRESKNLILLPKSMMI